MYFAKKIKTNLRNCTVLHHSTLLTKLQVLFVPTGSIPPRVCVNRNAPTHCSVTYRSEKAIYVRRKSSFARPLRGNLFS